MVPYNRTVFKDLKQRTPLHIMSTFLCFIYVTRTVYMTLCIVTDITAAASAWCSADKWNCKEYPPTELIRLYSNIRYF